MKKYRLLKDLPGVNAGAVFILKDGDYPCYFPDDNIRLAYPCRIRPDLVENNPEWFIQQEDAPEFTWADMIKFAYYVHERGKLQDKVIGWGYKYLTDFVKNKDYDK